MSKQPEIKIAKKSTSFSQDVFAKVTRKLKAQRNASHDVWFGLGMIGLVGWSVVVPTLLGAMFGIWLDRHSTGSFSWTLRLLIIGLIIGCLNAWYWVDLQDKKMHKENDDE